MRCGASLTRILISFALIAALSFFSASPVFAIQSITDNFDSYSTGNINGDNGGSGAWTGAWTNYGAGTLNTISTTQSYSSPNAQAVGSAGAIRQITSDTSFDFYVAAYTPSSGAPMNAIYISTDSSISHYCVYRFQSGSIRVDAQGGATASIGAYTQDAWNVLHIQGDTTNGCRGAINGGSVSSYALPAAGFTGIIYILPICDAGSTCGYVDSIQPTDPSAAPSTLKVQNIGWWFWW